MLAGKGFENIYNLSGGIKAWEKEVAVGSEDSGLFLFVSDSSPEETIITGFGLEMGLREFYLSMQPKVKTEAARELFGKLAEIEILHQQQLLKMYADLTGDEYEIEAFAEKVATPALEGGLSTEEYLKLYAIDYEVEVEIISLALAIEAQALDLYLRAAKKSGSEAAKSILMQIAEEERSHIAHLTHYIDQMQEA